MGRPLRLVAALVVLALLAAAPALADSSPSTNWAGYAVHRSGTNFKTVGAIWTQPVAACQPGRATYSAIWVGLGGYSLTSNALEQIGTEVDCTHSGRVVSSAWYELVPAASQTIRLVVHTGDEIAATVTVSGHSVQLALEDMTTHREFVRRFKAPSIDVSSAEWIVEAPSECESQNTCSTLPLAHFQNVQFTGAFAQTLAGHRGPISEPAWSVSQILLRPDASASASGRRGVSPLGAADPSALSEAGSAFSVSFMSSAPSGHMAAAIRRLN